MKAFTKLAVLASLSVSSLAFSDDTVGSGGTLAQLDVNAPSADTYLMYHGRAVIVTVTGKASTSAEYRWGGTSCGTRTLPDSMLEMLQKALENGTPIVPRYQLGQGDAKCLVGFKLTP